MSKLTIYFKVAIYSLGGAVGGALLPTFFFLSELRVVDSLPIWIKALCVVGFIGGGIFGGTTYYQIYVKNESSP